MFSKHSYSRVLGVLTLSLVLPCHSAVTDPITFGDIVQSYDGTPKAPTLALDPPDLEVDLRYTPPVLFHRSPLPEDMKLSYTSLAFSAQQTAGIGELLRFDGPLTSASEADVVLVTWAKAADYPLEALENPLGWEHPITLSLFAVDPANELTLIESTTESIFVPWRPLFNEDGSIYRKNGFAFRASFQFDAPVPLATRTMIVVSFDTQNSGFEPIGTHGPYDELNIGLSSDPITVGTDDDPGAILWIRNEPPDDLNWYYPATGFATVGMPMFRLFGPTPNPSDMDAPTNAGTYLVTGSAEPDGSEPVEESSLFTILPAAATVSLSDLIHLADGLPKSATATTVPGSLPLTITYDGSTDAPTALGAYDVIASVDDPNYSGQASGSLVIGYHFNSWSADQVTAGDLPVGMAGLLDDPDLDGIFNLAEYALALDPSEGSGTGTRVTAEGGGLAIVYRINRLATDIIYSVETTLTPEIPESWMPVVTSDSILSTDATSQEIRAELPQGLGGARRFARVAMRQVGATP